MVDNAGGPISNIEPLAPQILELGPAGGLQWEGGVGVHMILEMSLSPYTLQIQEKKGFLTQYASFCKLVFSNIVSKLNNCSKYFPFLSR